MENAGKAVVQLKEMNLMFQLVEAHSISNKVFLVSGEQMKALV